MEKYKVLKEFKGLTVDSVISRESIPDFTDEGFQELIDEGALELVREENSSDEEKTTQPVGETKEPESPATPDDVKTPEPTKTLDGKLIISDGFRTVGEKEYHHVKLSDGSSQDLTNEEYELKVIIQNNA